VWPHVDLNKKGKPCKARVNEWIINQIYKLQKGIEEVSNVGVGRLFLKSATTFLTSPTFPLLFSYLDLFRSQFSLD
jgi:hypothetical protein